MGFRSSILAGTTLVRAAIQSEDYVPGVSGWAVFRNGDVEFNSGTFRGTLAAAMIIGSVFGSSTTDPSIWINEDDQNTIRAYDAAGDLLLEIGARPGSGAGAVFYDTANPYSLSIGNQILWAQGSPLLTPFAAMYQTASGILLNTQLAGGVGFDILSTAWKWVRPGSDTLDTWTVVGSGGTAPAFNTNWATSTTFNGSTNWAQLQFQRTAHGRGALTGCWKAGATVPGLSVFNLPVGYRPAVQQPVWIERKTGTAPAVTSSFFGQVSTAGNLNIVTATGGGVAANDEYMIQAEYPLF